MLHREKTRTEIDGVLAVLHGELVDAPMYAPEALELCVSAKQVWLDRIRLGFGEQDTGAAIQGTRDVHALELRAESMPERLGKGSRPMECDLQAAKAEVMCFGEGKMCRVER